VRKIIKIVYVEAWKKDDVQHYRTTALLDNDEEAQGYGKDYKEGDFVEAWFDDKWDKYSMRLPND